MKQLLDFVLHLDKHLDALIVQLGPWAYVVFFLIIFCETGLVITPFLPGDSFLFALGAIAARGSLDLWVLMVSLFAAAVLGDTVNYAIGRYLGPKVFQGKKSRLFNRKHLERTHAFYERYGGKTIIIARFVPIIRTFAPFVAGIGQMSYRRFMSFNVVGGALWIISMLGAGFFFGNIRIVKRNFTFVVFAIIFISLLPAVIEFWRERQRMARGTSPISPARD